jgi:hypothetical protein
VREHRFNHGRRPPTFYRQLARLPNVVVIDPFESQFKYLKNADLVVTENGSSGWEGLMLGRRVITLAQTFYDGAGVATKVKDSNDLGGAIVDALATPAVADNAKRDQALGCMLDAERETSFSMASAGISTAIEALASMLARTRVRSRERVSLSKTCPHQKVEI